KVAVVCRRSNRRPGTQPVDCVPPSTPRYLNSSMRHPDADRESRVRSPLTTVADLQVGEIGLSSIKGLVGTCVLTGQAAIDVAALLRGRRAENAGWLTHSYIVTKAEPDGRVRIVEAMPQGARSVVLVNKDRLTSGFVWVRLPDDAGPPGWQSMAATAATQMVGTPYGWGQYLALAAMTLTGARPTGWLARFVGLRHPTTGLPVQVICSQLVDEALRLAGVHVFTDGRPPQYVTP